VQDWPLGHAAQAAPLAPQVVEDWESYAMQLPPLPQQPLGQLVALQVVTQAPLTHAWPLGQAAPVVPQTQLPLLQVSALLPQVTQTSPLEPQAVTLVPATQVLLLLQQPPLHGSFGPHAELQTWLLHASSVGQSLAALQPQTPLARHTWPRPLVVQLTHAVPPVPQVVVLEVWQVPLLSQQPLGQLVASQTHLPPTQRWPLGQVTHAPPLVPQNWLDVPGWQIVPMQQPLGQLVAVQTQVPFTHAWPAAQATQVAPFVPQLAAVCDAKATQAPLLVQQPPGQLVALQVRHLPFRQN
jgi:hypothetical protein